MIVKLGDKKPKVSDEAWVAPNAVVVGDVEIGEGASIRYSATIRGDVNKIKIGKGTSIQESSVVHVTKERGADIGDYCTIGHNVILHSCTIGDNVVLGMGSIVLDGAKIGDNAYIGPGSLVTGNKEIPPNTLAFGNPIKIVRELSPEEIATNKQNAIDYVEEGKNFKNNTKILD
jgi:carbonic anhydrase/acetyltransferase-like protein (isoleucine patch superfamily)